MFEQTQLDGLTPQIQSIEIIIVKVCPMVVTEFRGKISDQWTARN
jgi:hypothetical protein